MRHLCSCLLSLLLLDDSVFVCEQQINWRQFMMRHSLKTPKAPSSWMMISQALVFFLFIVRDLILKEGEREGIRVGMETSKRNRKLQESSEENEMERLFTGCSRNDIEIHQHEMSPLPDGIPAYRVQISNLWASNCSLSNIHLHCGWFSSATLVNPKVFKGLQFDDCLVNYGLPLRPGRSVFFIYANAYPYPISVSSLNCI